MKKPPGGLAASGQVQTRIADGGVVIPGAPGIGIRPGKIAQGRALGMIEGAGWRRDLVPWELADGQPQ